MHDGSIADLALLIQYVAAIDGIDRIRYTTSHPNEFSDSLIQAYADVPELVNHLHLPVQSGSDRILAAMKRNHMAIEYKSKIRKLRAIRPTISLSSDFIVGFPGENEQDFADTMKLINDVGFDHSFSFIYSARPVHRQTCLTMCQWKTRKHAYKPCKRAYWSKPMPLAKIWLAQYNVY